jgi:hypothetical protein
LFIGNLSNPDNFGAAVNSAILSNDNGNFNVGLKFIFNGRVTDAVWEDVNNDNQKDLLIASEWDAPKIYLNKKGHLTLQEIPENLNGLWQSISTFDVDLDGDKDIVLGNWGENNRFTKYMKNPILMYYGDLDKNGRTESLIAYKIDSNYYPMHSKSELVSQMNMISKKFMSHKDFALQPVETIFTEEALKTAKKSEIHTLSSGYLENNNGSFQNFIRFQDQLQVAPITSFSEIEINQQKHLLISGNSLKVNTYHGGYKALKGFLMNSTHDIKPVSDLGLDPFDNQIKETKVIKMKDKNVLLVLSNNDSLKMYSFKN